MREMKAAVQALVKDYEASLAAVGVDCRVSLRQVTEAVCERPHSSGLLDDIQRHIDRKREKENGWHGQRNRYSFAVLTFSPLEKSLVPREDWRKYAIILQRKGRPHIGKAPQETRFTEEAVLKKVAHRVEWMRSLAEKRGAAKACRDTWRDAIRYVTLIGYEEKKRILGKNRWVWVLLILTFVVLLTLLLWLLLS